MNGPYRMNKTKMHLGEDRYRNVIKLTNQEKLLSRSKKLFKSRTKACVVRYIVRKKNELQKTEQLPIPLLRAFRNFPDVKARITKITLRL